MFRPQWPISFLMLSCATGAALANPTVRLQKVTEAWRQTRQTEVPLELQLRPLVAADAAFNPDPGLALDKLGPGMRAEYDGLQYLLTSGLKSQFLGLSSDSLRAEWLRRYWRLRDPTPTTPENERRQEHERRVAHARAELSAAEPPGWDARGRIYIAYGEPDSIIEELSDVRAGLGYVPSRQDWLYVQQGWIAQFERPNPRGPWLLGKSSATLSYRPDIEQEDRARLGLTDPETAGLNSTRERASDIIGQQEERLLLAAKDPDRLLPNQISTHEVRTDLRARDLLRKRSEAIWSFSQAIERGTDRFELGGPERSAIWYVFDVDVFKGPPGRMRVEVHYQFNLQDLAFQWQDSLYVARYRIEGVLLDRDVREAATDFYTESVKSGEFRATLAARLLPGQLNFVVTPGDYRLAVRLIDLISNNEGTYTTYVSVPKVNDAVLALSDMEMATRIVFAGDDWRSRFVKRDRLVVPNPIGVYQRDNVLTSYFEIYGLEPDPEGVCRYQVTYSIVPRTEMQAEGWFPGATPPGRPFVSSSFMGVGVGRDLVEELRIDVNSLDQDAYDLVLTVTDLVSGKEASARSAFSVLD